MRRRRDIAADPERTSAETLDAIGVLIGEALPGADSDLIAAAIRDVRPYASYLIPGEHLARQPLTLVAGNLACDIFTLHGEDAVGVEEPAPPPGAAAETSWTLFVPVPEGAPFTTAEIEAANSHLCGGAAPADAGEPTAKAAAHGRGLSELLDLANRGKDLGR